MTQLKIFDLRPNSHLHRMEETVNAWLKEQGKCLDIQKQQVSENRDQLLLILTCHENKLENRNNHIMQVKFFRTHDEENFAVLEKEINEWFDKNHNDIAVDTTLQSISNHHLTMIIFFHYENSKSPN
ncbi:MAG TPA: hypothetical protein PLB38_01255 [bacterium]|nr:hypothetical protein [bacterium]